MADTSMTGAGATTPGAPIENLGDTAAAIFGDMVDPGVRGNSDGFTFAGGDRTQQNYQLGLADDDREVNTESSQPLPSGEIITTSEDRNKTRKRTIDNDRPFPPPGKRPTISEPGAPRIPPTRFAPEYKSPFLKLLQYRDEDLVPLLSHVNCSYLTPKHGNPPSLYDLKKHTQGLAVLIRSLTVTTSRGQIDNANVPERDQQGNEIPTPGGWEDEEAFDFLNDLRHAYQTEAASHKYPITTIVNNLKEVGNQVWEWCPLHQQYADLEKKPEHFGKKLPHDRMSNLVAHANECLEILDHNLQATGGILSLLPPEDYQTTAYKDASNTILGQMILFTQRLTARIHDLEIQYANAADVLAGEASVPSQTLTKLGPDGRFERNVVWPQDRFVLANAGEDVWQYINRELLKAEVHAEEKAKIYRAQGVVSERHWMKNDGGDEYIRGITYIDVQTRYFRPNGEQTVFVVPAHNIHPNTVVTREMEEQPQVVQVVKPEWPERTSEWEKRHARTLEEGRQAQNLLLEMTRERDACRQDITLLKHQEREHQRLFAEMETRMTQAEAAVAEGGAERLVEAQKKIQADMLEVRALPVRHAKLANREEQLEQAQKKLDEDRARFEASARRLQEKMREKQIAMIQQAQNSTSNGPNEETMNRMLAAYRRSDYLAVELQRTILEMSERLSLPEAEQNTTATELAAFVQKTANIIDQGNRPDGAWSTHSFGSAAATTGVLESALTRSREEMQKAAYERGRRVMQTEIEASQLEQDKHLARSLEREVEKHMKPHSWRLEQMAPTMPSAQQHEQRQRWLGEAIARIYNAREDLKLRSTDPWNPTPVEVSRHKTLNKLMYRRIADTLAEYAGWGVWTQPGDFHGARKNARAGLAGPDPSSEGPAPLINPLNEEEVLSGDDDLESVISDDFPLPQTYYNTSLN